MQGVTIKIGQDRKNITCPCMSWHVSRALIFILVRYLNQTIMRSLPVLLSYKAYTCKNSYSAYFYCTCLV